MRAALACLTLLAYAPGLTSPFQFDDRGSILRDASVQDLGTALASLGHSLRPLLKASYALSWALGGGNPFAFRVFNLAVHLVSTELVMRLGTAALRPRSPVSAGGFEPAAVLAGALFALHPLQTEAVTYVTGRSASLSTSFLLAALLAHVAGVRSDRRLLTLGVAPAAFLAAVATKETSAMFPLVLLAWEATLERPPLRVLVRRLAPWFVVSLGAAYALVMHPRSFELLYAVLGQRSLGESLRYGLGGVAYLFGRLSLLAKPCIDPGLFREPPGAAVVALTGFVLLSALLLSFRRRRERPLVPFGLLLFLLQALVLHVVLPRVDVINERHAYFANAGCFLAVAGLLLPFAEQLGKMRWHALAALSFAALLVALTVRRNLEYRTEVTLWEATVREAPENPRAYNNLGVAYELERRLPEARVAYMRALRLEPRYAAARDNLARVAPRVPTGALH